jgi:hypothetical protein
MQERTAETTKICHYRQSPGWDLNPGSSEYEEGVLTSQPGCETDASLQKLTFFDLKNKLLVIIGSYKSPSETVLCDFVKYAASVVILVMLFLFYHVTGFFWQLVTTYGYQEWDVY